MRHDLGFEHPIATKSSQAIVSMLLFQNWITFVIGVFIILLTYIDQSKEDKESVKKFGDAYTLYMKSVPWANFLHNILKLIQRKRKQSQEKT